LIYSNDLRHFFILVDNISKSFLFNVCEKEVTIKKAFKSGQVGNAQGYCPNGNDISGRAV